MHKFPYRIQYINDKIFEIVPLLIIHVVSIVFDFDVDFTSIYTYDIY